VASLQRQVDERNNEIEQLRVANEEMAGVVKRIRNERRQVADRLCIVENEKAMIAVELASKKAIIQKYIECIDEIEVKRTATQHRERVLKKEAADLQTDKMLLRMALKK